MAVLVAALVTVPLPALATPTTVAQPASTSAPTGAAQTAWTVPAAPVSLVITTEGGAPVTSKDDYVVGSMLLEGVTHPLEIKGRGNSTWTWPKKPYKLKLGAATSLLGMPAHEEWVLLANYADRSALRNYLALGLAATTRLAWSPRTRFVDVVLNGQPQGLYLLTDQVEQGAERVALPKDGFLLEIDRRFRASDEPGFRSARRTPVAFKDPDELTTRQRQQIKRAVRDFEEILYGDDFADPETGYAAHIDVDTVIDWYLVEELFRNQDSNFFSSVFLTWTSGTGFAMGPVWDFDLSAGTKWRISTQPQGWHTRYGRHWITRMFADPAFSTRVASRWAELRPTVDALVEHVPAAADVIRPSALANWPLWPVQGEALAGSVHADTFDGEVTFLRDWLAARAAWMSRGEAIFGRASWTVQEKATVINVPVRLLGERTGPVQVRYAWRSGGATPGSDFTLADGALTFGAGETVKTFPVTIIADGRREGPETLNLRLSSPDAPRLGQPSRLTLTIGASDQRPDVSIRRFGAESFVGDDVYNRVGRRQTQTVTARFDQARTFFIQVANDGNARSTIAVQGNRGGAAAGVRYYVGGTDITREMRSPAGWQVTLGAGRHRQVRAVVTVRRDAASGARPAARVRAVWRGDRRRVDLVRAVVAVR